MKKKGTANQEHVREKKERNNVSQDEGSWKMKRGARADEARQHFKNGHLTRGPVTLSLFVSSLSSTYRWHASAGSDCLFGARRILGAIMAIIAD